MYLLCNVFPVPALNTVSKNITSTVIKRNKMHGPQIMANWNSSNHCAAYHHANPSVK
jgi:hypothetical protein